MADTTQASQRSLLKSTIAVGNIRKSVASFNNSINSVQKTTIKLNQSLVKSNRFKQQSLSIQRVNFQKRREAVRRREREDIIEASGISGSFKRQGSVISQSTKGFLGRIMDFIGTLMVGWMVNNLPTIIRLGEELIGRITKLVGVFRSFIGNITNILSGFGTLIGGIFSSITSFDFNSQGAQIRIGLNQIEQGFQGMESNFDQALSILTQPLNLGFDQLDIEEPPAAPGAPAGVPESPSGGTRALLDVIGEAESPGKGYTAIAPGDYNPNLTKMTIAEANRAVGVRGGKGAIGRYQLTNPIGQAKAAGLDPNRDLFSPENQDKIALNLIKARGVTLDMIKNNPEEASVRLSAEWAGLPMLKVAGPYARKVGDSYYQGFNGNRSTISVDRLKKAFSQAVSEGQRPSTPTPITPVPSGRTSVIDEVNVSGPSGGTPTVGLSGKGGEFGAYRSPTRSHAGIDIGTSGQRGWYVAFRASGTVTFSGVAGGYGNLVIIKSGNTEYYFAHLAKRMVRQGESYIGQTIGEIGNTGFGSGIHLHYEVRPNGTPINPKPYLNLLAIGRNTSGRPEATTPVQASPQAQVQRVPTQERQKVADQITAERRGQTIFVPITQPQPVSSPPITTQTRRSNISISPSDQTSLNRMVAQKLLLDLAYT